MQQISRCWVLPCGIRGIKDLTVKVDLKINRDGTVLEAKFHEKEKIFHPLYQVLVESVRRAIMDPHCKKFQLNPKNYDQWKKIRINFDPQYIH